MTIAEKTFAGLSENEFQIQDGQWIINVEKPTICVFNVSWIDNKVDWNKLKEDHRDWVVYKIDCSDDEELIAKYGLSTFPSYVLLEKNKAPKLISAYISENDLIGFFDYYLQ